MERAEEIACIEHVRAADDMAEAAQKRLVEANLELVVSLAERHRSERIHILDLIQKGNVASSPSLDRLRPGFLCLSRDRVHRTRPD